MNTHVRLPQAPVVYGRQEPICRRCRGQRVLHIGCVDAGLVEERFERGELMHQKLASACSEVWGVDIDAEGIDFLRGRGFDNLFAGDITRGIPELDDERFDIIVVSEVLEHLDNPGSFLDAVFALMQPGHTQLVVTVPNAYRIDSLLSMLRGVEDVHPDHNYWFSCYTVSNLLQKRGFSIAEVAAYSLQPGGLIPDRWARRPGEAAAPVDSATAASGRPPLHRRAIQYVRTLPRRALVSLLYRRSPFWADGIMVVARRPL